MLLLHFPILRNLGIYLESVFPCYYFHVIEFIIFFCLTIIKIYELPLPLSKWLKRQKIHYIGLYDKLKNLFTVKGEMFEGKWYPLEKNLTYFLEEFSYVFLPSEIKVSFFKPQKYIFFERIFRNWTYETLSL